MKDLQRSDPLLSLCGLNCGLCTMQLGGYCGGCGFGNQSCKLKKCSLRHGGLEYCFLCEEYPCSNYAQIDEYDSFMTHQNQKADLEKAMRIGIEAYRREQEEKIVLLRRLLSEYNDGRRKTLYSLAVNLLELEELREALRLIASYPEADCFTLKEKAAKMAALLRDLAEKRGVELKLRKRPAK